VPERASGIVIFAHGSGSISFSPCNWFVAEFLQRAARATLLTDLLTVEEERLDSVIGELRFDIPLRSDRLVEIAD